MHWNSRTRLTLSMGGVIIAIAALIAYGELAPPAPDDVATEQLGGLAIDVLAHPTRVEAFRFCEQQGGCSGAVALYNSSLATPYPNAPLMAYKSSVPIRSLTPLYGELYSGANYQASGTLWFHPEVAYRFFGRNGEYADVAICLASRVVRIDAYSSPGARPIDNWIARDLNPQALRSVAHTTFPTLQIML